MMSSQSWKRCLASTMSRSRCRDRGQTFAADGGQRLRAARVCCRQRELGRHPYSLSYIRPSDTLRGGDQTPGRSRRSAIQPFRGPGTRPRAGLPTRRVNRPTRPAISECRARQFPGLGCELLSVACQRPTLFTRSHSRLRHTYEICVEYVLA